MIVFVKTKVNSNKLNKFICANLGGEVIIVRLTQNLVTKLISIC